MNTSNVMRESIKGSRTFSNYLIILIFFIAGLSFFLVGLSSFTQKNLFPFTDASQISFLPQGIVMTFYGTLALIVAFFLLISLIWDIGSGYNEFSQTEQIVRIVRKDFPQKGGLIFLSYPFQSIKKLKVKVDQGLNPRNNIFLVLRDQREIPLYPSQNFILISELEKKAIELAEYLDIPLETENQNYTY